MDKYMLFDKHVSELIKKIVGILMFLNRSSSALDKPSRITVVQTLALSRLNDCLRIWGTTNKTIMSDAQKLHNFAAKVAIGGAKKFEHATPIIQELGWLKNEEKMYWKLVLLYLKS